MRLARLALIIAVVFVAAGPARAVEPEKGKASWYGPGDGVATPWCTWARRTTRGCGLLAIRSLKTGLVAIVPVVDWCQCYRGTSRARIVDLQLGVVAALGLDPAEGIYDVETWRAGGGANVLPNTALPEPGA